MLTKNRLVFLIAAVHKLSKKTQFISIETIKREYRELLRFDHYRVEGISHFKVCIMLFYFSQIYSKYTAWKVQNSYEKPKGSFVNSSNKC